MAGAPITRITRSSDFPFLTDWFAISFRWLALVAIVSSLTAANIWGFPESGVILFLGLWNLAVTFLAMLNRRMPEHRKMNVVVDLIGSLMLVTSTGGIEGPVAWSGLLPLFSAAIYYEWVGSLLILLSLVIYHSAQAAISNTITSHLFILGLLFGFYLFVAVSLGLLSRRLIKSTRQIYFTQVKVRQGIANNARMDERSRLQTYYKMAEVLSATLSYHSVLESALDLCISALDDTHDNTGRIVCAIMLFGESDLHVGAARGFSVQEIRMTTPGLEGALYNAVKMAEIVLLENPAIDPEISKFAAVQNCQSGLCVPLLHGLNAYGVMLFAHPDADYFTPGDHELLEMVSHQIVISIQNARLFQELEEEKRRIIQQQEDTRKQLARDLHDGPTQTVASIAMRINVARVMLEKKPEGVEAELASVEELARNTTREIRHMLFTLRPLVLESEGLIVALNDLSARMRDTYQQNVLVEVEEQVVEKMKMTMQAAVFHICEEAINNAGKHAKADKILIRLNFVPEDTRVALLEIMDDGIGFDVNKVMGSYEKRGSLGMRNLQERSDLINAIFRMESTFGKGTCVRVYIPLTPEAIELLQRGKGMGQ
jgi:signal transduction histidine kinase